MEKVPDMRVAFSTFLIVATLALPIAADADDGASTNEADVTNDNSPSAAELNWNLPLPTAGGAQLWTDHLHRSGYRLQQNAVTGHWRLLDAGDIRRAWGTRQQCETVLERLQPREKIDAAEHVVVLLHGLMRTRHSMKPLETKLAAAGYPAAIRFSYASTRISIGDSAVALRETLEDFPESTTFSFVGHSMGNIVVRHLIADLQRDDDPADVLPRCKSMVMLGPPNQGAALSRRLAPTGLYGWITGRGGLQLGPEWDEFENNLATPPFPFAIIAGDVSGTVPENPLAEGTGDFVVLLDEADLEGREWLNTVPVLHSFLMNDPVTISMTIKFIDQHQ